ncbi:hypothetical protein ABID22_004112 [Pontibacter aydingkolensis]|uniref:DUF4382 domain-containing protein n=1 Tax=Pontibacter aydingkolensis TaxID=1911536 RepID=A0ABS7CZN9_9BACT|nr:hypothetical protein [Pontibacter aydingkolensis]MBW7469343.1 hypothetical protein [Pontibacter aydingkolensis]
MKRNYFMAMLLGSLALFSACDSETASPQTQMGLDFNTVKTASVLNGRLASNNSLAFTSGTIVLSQVRFEGESASGFAEIEFELEQDVTIDFATGATNPDISAAAFPPGTYSSVEVELELQDSGTKPAVVLNGTFIDAQGQQHPVRFEFNSAETFEVEKEGTITFTEGQSAVAQVTFDPTVWFAGVSAEQLSSATKNTQGVIVISSTQNTNIFDVVADGLDLATEVEISK